LFENKINICTTIRLSFCSIYKKNCITKLNKNIITIRVIYSRKNYFKEYFNYLKNIIGKTRLSTRNNFVKKANKMFYTIIYNELTFTTTYS